MLVKFLLDTTISPDGKTLLEVKAGDVKEFDADFAAYLAKHKVAVIEAAVEVPVLETKVIETKVKGRK